jgi:hypothetical protein
MTQKINFLEKGFYKKFSEKFKSYLNKYSNYSKKETLEKENQGNSYLGNLGKLPDLEDL